MEKKLRDQLPDGKFQNVSETQSRRMGAIRGRNNRTTERRFRLALVRAGIRGFKVNPKGIKGNPDFVFLNGHVAVFIDGCFWHGCPRCSHEIKTNSAFWQTKIRRNQERDATTTAYLQANGFTVVRIWEHELEEDLPNSVGKVLNAIG